MRKIKHYRSYSWEKDLSACGRELIFDEEFTDSWRWVSCKKCIKLKRKIL